MAELPSGVVTFLFTDVEGSTGLWERDESGMDAALSRHDDVMRASMARHGGHVFSTAGDSFAVAFATPLDAVSAAVEAQLALGDVGLRVRMGLHTGDAHERHGGYFGPALNRAARLMEVAHGGQVVASNAVAELAGDRVELRDLGRHRLRDLSSPVHVWQVVAPGLVEEFPPLRAVDAARSNLPVQPTSLIGRDREVDALATAMTGAGVVTVTGVGGIGKTRVAVQAAAGASAAFPGGVWLASLGAVDSPGSVADVVLAAVGGRRQAQRSALAALAELAAGRRLLVVLDNCEHVLRAAGECAEAVVAGGLSAVLATSREPLGVAGEQVFPVPSLAPVAAVALFVERARAADRSFHVEQRDQVTLSEICRRLDGMPLAIELAAARVRSMTVADIAKRLDARFRLLRGGPHGTVERHRTLQAAVRWSYDLLDAHERAAFQRLSVFAGRFEVDAVTAVCGDDDTDAFDTVDLLDGLIARSMVVADRSGTTTGYSLLETLRQFGEEMLVAAGDAPLRRSRHAQHFLGLAEAARVQMSTPDAASAMATFDNGWNNFRVAFEWFESTHDVSGALHLVVAAGRFAELRHRFELLTWAERAITLDNAREHDLWPEAAGATASLRCTIGDPAGAESLASEALRIDALNGTPTRFEPAQALFIARWTGGQTERAIDALPELERVAEKGMDPIELGLARYMRVIGYFVNDLAGVGSFAEDAVRDAEASRNPHQLAFAYLCRLVVAVGRKDTVAALNAFTTTRRWAETASNLLVRDVAPLFLAMASREDEPLETLSLVRDVLASYYDSGYWGNLDMALRRVLLPLTHLGRHRAGAVVLGGLMKLPSRSPDTQSVIPRTRTVLADQLGADLQPLLNQGRLLTTSELVHFALREIDACLHPA